MDIRQQWLSIALFKEDNLSRLSRPGQRIFTSATTASKETSKSTTYGHTGNMVEQNYYIIVTLQTVRDLAVAVGGVINSSIR